MGIHQSTPRPAGQRFFNRVRLGVPASLVLTHGTHPCLIDDISCTGSRLRTERTLPVGVTAVLAFHQLRLMGVVRWMHSGQCGLQFERPLEIDDMQGMVWITENRDLYNRLCETGHASDWVGGIGQ